MRPSDRRLHLDDVIVSPCGLYRWRVVEVVTSPRGPERYVLASERTPATRLWPATYEEAMPRGWTVERAHDDACQCIACRADLEPTASDGACEACGASPLGGPEDTETLCRDCAWRVREMERTSAEVGW